MIVIPMAGQSSRFTKAGFTQPKHQLPLWGETVFFHCIQSFAKFFETIPFVFIFREEHGNARFIETELHKLGLHQYFLCPLAEPTQGQAETVFLGTRQLSDDTPLTIFNIDTIRPGFDYPDWANHCDAYLEVFRGEGAHWSFVAAGPDLSVQRTTEKERISDLCSNGLYHFRRKSDFEASFLASRATGQRHHQEFYIAPLFNHLIQSGKTVRYQEVSMSQNIFCGTPDEYHLARHHHD